jgi:hypothetical protein
MVGKTRVDSVRRWLHFCNQLWHRDCSQEGRREATMLNETDRAAGTPELQEDSTDAQKASQERLSRIANKSVTRMVNRQQRYDGEHGIFIK